MTSPDEGCSTKKYTDAVEVLPHREERLLALDEVLTVDDVLAKEREGLTKPRLSKYKTDLPAVPLCE